MATQILFANRAGSTLAGPITNTALTANLAAGTGVLFPQPQANQYFVLTFIDAATGLLTEIVHVTNVTGDVITMQRGQENTTALNWLAGDKAQNLHTAGVAASFGQYNGTNVWRGTNTFVDPNGLGGLVISGAASGAAIQLTGNGTGAPSKWISVANGVLRIVNNAFNALILTLDDLGNLFVGSTITAAGNIASAATVSGINVNAQNNMTAGGTIQGNAIAATGNLSGLNIAAANNISANNIITAPSIQASSSLTSVNMSASGAVAGNTVIASSLVSAGTYVTAELGAFGSGDPNVACILGDFTLSTLGIDTIVARLPNGLTFYGNVASITHSGGSSPIEYVITFPNSFAFSNSIMFTLAAEYGPTPPVGFGVGSRPLSTTQIGISINGPTAGNLAITYLAFGF